MSAAAIHSNRWRTLLDCLLVLLLLLAISPKDQPALGGAGTDELGNNPYKADPGLIPTSESAIGARYIVPQQFSEPLRLPDPNEANPSGLVSRPYQAEPELAQLDIKILAAIIAAENAALNPPQYGINLPVITR